MTTQTVPSSLLSGWWSETRSMMLSRVIPRATPSDA